VLLSIVSTHPSGSAGETYPATDLAEQTLAVIRGCVTRAPAPWPDAWQTEYLDTLRDALRAREDFSERTRRLHIVRKGFPLWWESLTKGQDRSLFEVHRAQTRWYVENLMNAGLPGEEEMQTLRYQYEDLAEHAATSLVAQFPFLDPNMVRKARADYLSECYRNINAPLLPIFLTPFSLEQVEKIKQRWYDLRYARVDLWQQFERARTISPENPDATLVRRHPNYLLARRSLEQLRPHIWAIAACAPDYYRSAVANHAAAQKRCRELRSQARRQEIQIGIEVLQTECLSFLLAALLETAECVHDEGE
jgi:hypothetical protein